MATLEGLVLLHREGACRRAAAEFRDDGMTPWSLGGTAGAKVNKAFIERYCDGGGEDGGGCPVREECLEFALAVPTYLDYHVWGGTTPAEREVIRRERGLGGGSGDWTLENWVALDLRDDRDVGVRGEVGLVSE